jgi:hypothetical protein
MLRATLHLAESDPDCAEVLADIRASASTTPRAA